jgi:hypothetical protein
MTTPHLFHFTALAFAWTAAASLVSAADWQPLLPDAQSFSGFKQLGGKATYAVKDGIVTGTSVPREPNTFMATEKEYADFELEYEFKVDPKLNSGVQFRSHSRPEVKNGRVHGYQCEIDPSNRAWSAGIYDEGNRGWLNTLKDRPEAQKAFKPGDWNKVRIRAVGNHMQTWINDVPAADLRDAGEISGFIALQVHGVGIDAAKIGTQVQWRNLRLKDLGRHEWKPLLKGSALDGWKAAPGGSWMLKDGVLRGENAASDARHGILLSEKDYGDFTIRLKFRSPKGNSGFYFRAEPVAGAVSVHGFQAEVCDNQDTGGLYETGGRAWVVHEPKTLLQKPNDPASSIYKPGEWTDMWVSAHGNRLTVHINGVKTADLIDEKQTRPSGRLGFQLHGSQDMAVEFKNIEILTPVP